MRSTRYRRFTVMSRPYRIDGSGWWTVDFEIHCGPQRRTFSLQEHCPTEADAEARCIDLGHRIIDGRIPGGPSGIWKGVTGCRSVWP